MPDIAAMRRGALDHLAVVAGGPADAGLVLSHHPHETKIALRSAPSADFEVAVARAVGVAPPRTGLVAEAGGWAIAWLGPDEWLAIGPPGQEATMPARLHRELAGHHAAVVDVTNNATTIGVAGPAARAALATACPIDLHPRAFGPGRVVQSRFASVDVILRQTEGDDGPEGPAFRLTVRRSFAEHVWLWLADAGRSHGVRIIA